MIQKIGDPMQGDRRFSASGASLYDKDLIFCIPNDRILFPLDRLHDIFESDVSVFSQFPF